MTPQDPTRIFSEKGKSSESPTLLVSVSPVIRSWIQERGPLGVGDESLLFPLRTYHHPPRPAALGSPGPCHWGRQVYWTWRTSERKGVLNYLRGRYFILRVSTRGDLWGHSANRWDGEVYEEGGRGRCRFLRTPECTPKRFGPLRPTYQPQ